MKVAIIEPVGGHGGMNYYDMGLLKGLINARCDAVLYTSVETNVPSDLSCIVNKSFKGIWGDEPKILRALRFVYCLLFSLVHAKINGVGIVHYHFFHYSALELLCVRFATIFRFNIVVTAHDVESFANDRGACAARKILAIADKIIVHNKVSSSELITRVELPASSISVIPHGNYLDFITDFPEQSAARKKIGLNRDDKVLLFFGQIKKVKGLDILLNALSEVIAVHPSMTLVIAGKVWKDSFTKYEKIINDNSLANNVISRIHYIDDSDVVNYFCAADLIVLPYRKIYQSGVLLMAMSYKVPVLTSDIPGMTEIVVDGENGHVFKSESVSSLSTKIIDLFLDSDRLVCTGLAGFDTVDKKFNWKQIGQMTSDLYKTLSNER